MFSVLFTIGYLLLQTAALANGCDYDGIFYKEGEKVKTQDPCLECTCENRQIQCRLKMCPTLPEPPPPSCHILQRPNTCCPRLLCQNGMKFSAKGRSGLESKLNQHHAASNSEGCILNGTVYGEGSAMVTSSLCEYCYCIKGKQHCVRPQCVLSVPGCYPVYNKHSCCPTNYNCSSLSNTTTPSSTTKIQNSTPPVLIGCEVNGTVYPEGERIAKMEGQCEHCYCMKGKVMCDPVLCKVPVNNLCTPVHSNGHCCPTSYNCSSASEEIRHPPTAGDYSEEIVEDFTVLSNDTTTEISPESETTTENVKENNETEGTSTLLAETTEFTTTIINLFNDTEERSGAQNEIIDAENFTTSVNTSTEINSEIVTATTVTNLLEENSTTSSTLNNITSPVRSIPDVIEAIINRTLEKDDDYEYDYNESSLPPSLPNLKIIPFVAADAVVNDPDDMYGGKSRTSENPIYFDIPMTNRFSPPAETEGGFMPRDPIIDGPFYETKFDEPYTSGNPGILLEHTSETLLPPITEPPKLFEEGKCQSKGRTYHHGEVVSEPNACELCVCYYGEVHCQQPKCTPLNDGCHRVQDVKNACCGRVVCDTDEKETPLKQSGTINEEVTPSTFLPESLSNIPAITVADVIVTPNPFKDVIRTEPAPDLIYIMKDMIPHLQQESSALKNEINITADPNISHLFHENVTEFPSLTTAKQNETVSRNNVTNTSNTYNSTSIQQNEDYEDTFSFGTVLDLLFNSALETNKTKLKNPVVLTTTEFLSTVTTNKPLNLSINDVNADNSDTNFLIFNENKLGSTTDDKLTTISTTEINLDKNSTPIISGTTVTEQGTTGLSTTLDNIIDFKLQLTTESLPILTTAETTNLTTNTETNGQPPNNLLKLAGCNIYGRMYRVGRIISELSGPCLECMCTEVGVQCRKLSC